MKLSEFEAEPTEAKHPCYATSFLYPVAPEWSTGEVLLAAACRGLLLGVSEKTVDLGNIERVPSLMSSEFGGPVLWNRLLSDRGGFASPLRHGQYSPTSSRQLMPLVPSLARVAGVLGKKPRSRWNPTTLLLEAVGGGVGPSAGEQLIRDFGDALTVSESDDVFARFTERAMQAALKDVAPKPADRPPYTTLVLSDDFTRGYRDASASPRKTPSERFCLDLGKILSLKKSLTRRQWTVLVEAVLRLGLGMHVMWTCSANILLWELAIEVASGHTPPTPKHVEKLIWESHDETRPLLELGADAKPLFDRLIERYADARTGINVLLCQLEDVGVPWAHTIGFSNGGPLAPQAIGDFLSHVHTHRQAIDSQNAGKWLRTRVADLFDKHAELRELARHKAGYTKNLYEFIRHSLGQISAKSADQRCYDLSYIVAFVDDRRPMPTQPGQAALIALVHACCACRPSIPASLDDFKRHLADYGLRAPAGQLVHGKTGHSLSMLGLVMDSPDASGGRLLVRPF